MGPQKKVWETLVYSTTHQQRQRDKTASTDGFPKVKFLNLDYNCCFFQGLMIHWFL